MSRTARLQELLFADNSDRIAIVDISDTSISIDGKEKFITVENLIATGGGGDLPVHNIIGDKHNGVGNPFDLIGFADTDTLGLITPSSDPGVDEKILKTDTDGEIDIEGITTKIVRSDEELFINSPSLVSVNANNIELTAVLGTTVNSLLNILGNIDVTGKIDVTETIIADDFIKSLVSMNAPVYTSDGDLLINAGNDVKIDSTSNLIKILAENSLQSDHFVSQLTGWRMTYDGELDTRYMYSDQLKVKLFIADLEQALAGSSILTKSSTTLSRPFVVPFPGEYNLLYVDDLPSAEGMAVAESGDMVRLRKYSRTGGSLEYTDVWGVVTEYADQADKEQRWKFTRVSGGASVSTPAMVGSIQTYAAPASTSAVLTKPTGTSEGHTLYAFFVLDSATVGVTAPDVDWTLLASDNITGLSVFLFSKVAGASEGSDYTFSFDESVTVNSSLQTWSGIESSEQVSVTKEETATTTFTTGSLDILGVNETQFLFAGFNASLPATEPTYWVESLDTGFGSIRQYCAWTNGFDIGEHGFAEGTISGSATSITISLNATPTYSGLDLETGYAEPYSVIAADTFAIDYGVSGNGFIEMTTVDGAYGSNSPYMRVVTWVDHPVTGATVRTMNGNLNGIFSVSDEFGFFAGDGVTDADEYIRLSNEGNVFNNIPIEMHNSGSLKVTLDATQGLEFLLPTAADTLTMINWKESLPSGDTVAAIDVYSVGDATTMLLDITAQTDDTGQIILRSNNDVGTSTAEVTLQAFDTADDARITLNANTINLGSILETDDINILTNNGTLDIEAIVTVEGKLKVDTASESFTTSNWGKALELTEGMAVQWLRSGSAYSRGIGYTSDGNLYFFKSTANDNSAAPLYDLILSSAGWLTATNLDVTTQIGSSWTTLTLNTGWVNYGSPYDNAGYKKVGDLVFLEGFVVRTSGTETIIATLPVGYRPAAQKYYTVATSTGYGVIVITTAGQIVHVSGGFGFVQLDGLNFSTI